MDKEKRIKLLISGLTVIRKTMTYRCRNSYDIICVVQKKTIDIFQIAMEVDRIMKIDVYDQIPVMESDKFLLREINEDTDAEDLLKVYSDEAAVPLFNSDNCVNDFYYVSIKEMKDTIEFWKKEYEKRYYVRWAVIDKNSKRAIGTIELFNRKANDYFNNCGLLRLDLRSDYEKQDDIEDILAIIVPKTKEMFACEKIATKAIPIAKERIKALEHAGFHLSGESVIGHDGTNYGSYYVMEM